VDERTRFQYIKECITVIGIFYDFPQPFHLNAYISSTVKARTRHQQLAT
jgi:hypothetical protein